jgi:membrane-associated protease RseP (regulator of RpoE activity)
LDQPQNPNHPDPVIPPQSCPLPEERRGAESEGGSPADAAAAPPPPMTPVAWLLNNGIYLLLGALVGWVLHRFGLEWLWYGLLIVFGLGFLIFVHELGHFLAAKWCDVHVQTFSIGFGPALPGCSFQRGETTYKIGMIPLGGYVNMVGEGPEADEDEDYPRSFKNKSVGQRMVIISAGVFMNVLLACILFVIVYRYHGVGRPPAIVGRVDAGSPMWVHGVRSGTVITDLAGIHHPYFDDLKIEVVLSQKGEEIPFTLAAPGGPTRTLDLEPRRDARDPNPIVGMAPPHRLVLPSRPSSRAGVLTGPFLPGSAAAAARPLSLRPGEVVTACSADPDHPDDLQPVKHNLDAHTFDAQELGQRLARFAGRKFVIRVQAAGAAPKPGAPATGHSTEDREVPAAGFEWGDTVVGSTRPEEATAKPFNPFAVSPLPLDPRDSSHRYCDPFVLHERMERLAGKPMIVQVRRHGAAADAPPVDVFVPPAFHMTFGMRMEMGEVAAVREGSAAEKAGLRKADLLTAVVMKDAGGTVLYSRDDLDPERLPFELARAAGRVGGKKQVTLKVRRPDHHDPLTLGPLDWDASWDFDEEAPQGTASPLPVPQLGLAYWVMSRVVEVKPDGPAAAAGLKRGDKITALRFQEPNLTGADLEWSKWVSMESRDDEENKVFGRWAHASWLLDAFQYTRDVQFKKRGDDGKESGEIQLQGQPDPDWPLASRGLLFESDLHLEKANSLGEALVMGGKRTLRDIKQMYLSVRALVTGRVSTEQVGGPLAILSTGFIAASSGWYDFLLVMAFISVNLAVVNFLPIPVLDGGHMVFLIYEKLRGRPPSESVRIAATYVGLAAIATLMIFVFYQDIRKLWFGG